jgi:hypothetical protein
MNTETFEVQDRLQEYNKISIDKKIILIHTDILKKYKFDSTAIDGLFDPSCFGFTEICFGGNINRCAQVKDSPYVLLLNTLNQTIGVHIPTKNLSKLKNKELEDILKRFNIEFLPDTNKSELIKLLIA